MLSDVYSKDQRERLWGVAFLRVWRRPREGVWFYIWEDVFLSLPESICKISYTEYIIASGIFGKKMVSLLSLRARPKRYLCSERQLLNLVVNC
jgi:hypothetical protein